MKVKCGPCTFLLGNSFWPSLKLNISNSLNYDTKKDIQSKTFNLIQNWHTLENHANDGRFLACRVLEMQQYIHYNIW